MKHNKKNIGFCILLIIFMSVSIYADINTGLVSYYNFDDISGTTTSAQTRQDNYGKFNLTATGDAYQNRTVYKAGSGSYYLDGAGDSLYTDVYNIAGSFTVNLWVNNTVLNAYQAVFSRDGANNKFIMVIDDRAANLLYNNYIRASTVQNSLQTTFAASQTPTNNWVMLTMIYDNENDLELFYVNGVNYVNITGVTELFDSTIKSELGVRSSTNNYYKGFIDEVAIYNRTLTSTEIQSYYTGYTPINSTPTPTVNILNITANGETFINNTVFEVNYINFNVTYQVNNSDIGNFTNSSITQLTNQPNGIYYIQFEACYNTTCDTSINYTYTINVTTDILFDEILLNENTLQSTNYINITDLNFYIELLNISTNGNINSTFFINGYKPSISSLPSFDNKFITNSLNGSLNLSEYTPYNNLIEFDFTNNPRPNINGTNIFITESSSSLNETAKAYCEYKGLSVNNINYFGTTTTWQTDLNYFAWYNGSEFITELSATNRSQIIEISCGFPIDNGVYNISFYAENNETYKTTNNYSIIIDTINPIINNNIPSEINTYNWTNIIINSTDTNLDTCLIEIDGSNYSCDVFTSYNFTTNGYKNWTITALDLAGNIKTETGNLLVNPPFYVYFNNGTSNLQNFTVNDTSYQHYFTGNIYDYGLGTHLFNFKKNGYQEINFNLTFTNTSNINQTLYTSTAYIAIFIYDRNTGLRITDSVNIDLIGTFGFNDTTTTGALNISSSSLLDESYQVISSSTNYISESVYFTFTNREVQQVDIYMIKYNLTNYGTHTIKAITDTGLLVNNAICKALEWKPALSAFVSVAQGLTDSNGETLVNIELGTKLYKFECTKGSNSAISSNKIIALTGTTTTIQLASTILTPSNLFSGITYSLTNSTYNATHQRITFEWTDLNGLVDIGCLKIYKVIGTKFTELQSSCVSSASSSIQLIQDINVTYEIRAISSINVGGIVTDLDYIVYQPTNSIAKSLKDYGLDIIIPLLFIVIGFSLGFLLEPKNIYISIISTIIMTWSSVIIVPTILSSTIATFVTIICGLMLWGGYKFK